MQGGEISSPRMTKRTVLQVRVTGRYCRSNRFTTNESNENPEWSLIRIAKTVDSVVEKNRRIRTERGRDRERERGKEIEWPTGRSRTAI